MEVGKENKSSLHSGIAKHGALPSKTLATRRPALGEVGNKISVHQQNNKVNTKSKSVVTKLKTTEITKQTEDPVKKEETKNVTNLKHTTTTKTVTKTEIGYKVEVSSSKREKISNIAYSTLQLRGIADPDINDNKNPYLVTEYVEDILNYLRQLESEHQIHKGYLTSHKSSPSMRRILVNWMVDANLNFLFQQETLHLSVTIVDQYLQINKNVGRDTLQLIGVTAMFIASKYEEIMIPEFSDFIHICDGVFKRSDIIKMEYEMLRKLQFQLGRPQSIHFLRRYNKVARFKLEEHNLSKYLVEVFLLEYELCHIKPSLQAAAACCLSLCIMNNIVEPSKIWTNTMVHFTKYKYSDVKPVILNLVYYFVKMEQSKYKAIQQKYARSILGKISCHPKLKGPVVQKLFDEAVSLKKQ